VVAVALAVAAVGPLSAMAEEAVFLGRKVCIEVPEGAERPKKVEEADEAAEASKPLHPMLIWCHPSSGDPVPEFKSWKSLGVARQGAILVCPQAAGRGWGYGTDAAFIDKLITHLVKNLRVDPERIVIGGHSSGAIFATAYGLRHPDLFHAVIRACGATSRVPAARANSPMVYVFHSVNDRVFPYKQHGRGGAAGLYAAGYTVELTTDKIQHNIGMNCFNIYMDILKSYRGEQPYAEPAEGLGKLVGSDDALAALTATDGRLARAVPPDRAMPAGGLKLAGVRLSAGVPLPPKVRDKLQHLLLAAEAWEKPPETVDNARWLYALRTMIKGRQLVLLLDGTGRAACYADGRSAGLAALNRRVALRAVSMLEAVAATEKLSAATQPAGSSGEAAPEQTGAGLTQVGQPEPDSDARSPAQLLRIGKLYKANGLPSKARETFRQLIEAHPTSSEAATARRELQALGAEAG
jgi:pimeloyl-ACP methyl ester carboxylesterase